MKEAQVGDIQDTREKKNARHTDHCLGEPQPQMKQQHLGMINLGLVLMSRIFKQFAY